jgi:hypothetical protein
MTPEQFESMMRAWGSYYGERRGPEWDEGGADPRPGGATVHPLARAQAFAPGTRKAALERMHLRRAGVERRRAMGAAAGIAILPAEFVDPIPCIESRPVVGTPRHDPRYTDSVKRVQEAWLVLRQWWPVQAEIVRLHYQVRGFKQAEKAQMATAVLGTGDVIGLKRFRDELRLGRTWLHARLSR